MAGAAVVQVRSVVEQRRSALAVATAQRTEEELGFERAKLLIDSGSIARNDYMMKSRRTW